MRMAEGDRFPGMVICLYYSFHVFFHNSSGRDKEHKNPVERNSR